LNKVGDESLVEKGDEVGFEMHMLDRGENYQTFLLEGAGYEPI